MARILLLFLASGLLEIPFFAAFFGGKNSLLEGQSLWVWTGHFLAALLLFVVGSPQGRTLCFFTALLPGWGWLGSLLLFSLSLKRGSPDFKRSEEGQEAFWWEVPETSVQPRFRETSRSEQVQKELDLMSLADILIGADNDLKRGAVEKLAQIRTPEAIQTLLQYRSDPSLEVRFYVTSALTRIKKDFDEELVSAKKGMKQDLQKVSARVFLAKIYLQYVRSGLLDEGMRSAYEREALYHLRFAIETPWADREAYWMLTHLHQERGEGEEALAVLKKLEEVKKVPQFDLVRKSAEIHYEQGNYHGLLADLRWIREKGINDKQWVALSQWWGV